MTAPCQFSHARRRRRSRCAAIMSGAWLVWRAHAQFRMGRYVLDLRPRRRGLRRRAVAARRARAGSRREALLAASSRSGRCGSGCTSPAGRCGITDDPRYAKLSAAGARCADGRCSGCCRSRLCVSLPLALSMSSPPGTPRPGFRTQDISGLVVLAAGIVGEGGGRPQLRRFRADPAQPRPALRCRAVALVAAPNYFFEWLGWIAYPLFAIDLGGAYAVGLARARRTGLHVLAAGPRLRHPAARGAMLRAPRAMHSAPIRRAPARSSRAAASALSEAATTCDTPAGEQSVCPCRGRRRGWPDAVTRGDRLLVGRTRQRLRDRPGDADRASPPPWRRTRSREHRDAANAQHYEMPEEFFALRARAAAQIFLLPLRQGATTRLREAEERALAETARPCRPGRRAARSWSWAAAGAR